MKSLKKNRKGMTLVEVVIAMTLLGIASTMIVMSLVAAVQANGRNYKRASDVDDEGVYAETFDVSKSYTSGNVKVEKNTIGSSGTNKVKLGADFGGANGQFEIDNVYSFKSKLPGKSKTVDYQLQFFQSKDNNYADPTAGNYFVVIYNDSSVDISNWKFKCETDGYFFDANNVKFGDQEVDCPILPNSGGKASIGVFTKASSGIYLTIEGGSFQLTSTNLDSFSEKDENGNPTGMVYIHYTGSGFQTQAQFDGTAP